MRVCHGCLSPVDNSRRILLPLQDLLFTTEVFLDLPSRKIGSCHFEHILFGLDFFICGKHHWMFCDAINQYQINIFSGSCNLDFDMGNVSLMIFPLIKYIGFNFPFATVAQFRSKCPFIVIKKLAFSKRAEPRSIASKVTVLADL